MSSTDPFDIGQDVFRVIVSNLDPQSLARSLLVSKNWLLACSSPSLWRAHCEEMWADKLYIPPDIKSDADFRRAFVSSLRDSCRTAITATELCTIAWTFKFKHQALDHAVHGINCEMIRYFQHDGSYITGENDSAFQHPRYRWRFTTCKDGCPGLYIQVNRYPKLSISRTQDWGWRLENTWVLFTSIPTTRRFGPTPAPAAAP